MMHAYESAVRWTHLPTGLTARSNQSRSRSHAVITPAMSQQARAMLAAKVAMLARDPEWREGVGPLIRSYHLHPRLGIPPFASDHQYGHRTFLLPGSLDIKGADIIDRIMLDRRRAMIASPPGS